MVNREINVQVQTALQNLVWSICQVSGRGAGQMTLRLSSLWLHGLWDQLPHQTYVLGLIVPLDVGFQDQSVPCQDRMPPTTKYQYHLSGDEKLGAGPENKAGIIQQKFLKQRMAYNHAVLLLTSSWSPNNRSGHLNCLNYSHVARLSPEIVWLHETMPGLLCTHIQCKERYQWFIVVVIKHWAPQKMSVEQL